MKKTVLALSLLTLTVLTLPVSCKKDKNPTPGNQGQQGSNNNNNNNNNNGGYSNSTLYFRGTVNGAKTEWSQGSLSYRLRIRGGAHCPLVAMAQKR